MSASERRLSARRLRPPHRSRLLPEAQAEFERQRAAAEREKAEAAAREQVLAEKLARKSKRLSLVAVVVACIAIRLAVVGT